MKGKVLITDSLFIFDEHVKKIEAAGYEVERLDKPEATDEELSRAIKGKVGYILGGVEHVGDKVIEAADELKVIAMTGIDYKSFIPAWQKATEKGIAIVNTPDTPTQAVAEWAMGAALLMNRGFLELGRTGDKKFLTTKGLESQKIGIVGLGRIGTRITKMLEPFKPGQVLYYSEHRHGESGLEYKPIEELLAICDIVFVCVPKSVGDGFINAAHLSKMKQGALLVSIGHPGIIDEKALFDSLNSGKLRAISDHGIDNKSFSDLPITAWFCFNGANAFNTEPEIKLTSDTAVESLLNILSIGDDKYLVNPEYKTHR